MQNIILAKDDKKVPVETLKTISKRELYLLEQEVDRLRKQVGIYENSKMTEKLSVEDKCLIVIASGTVSRSDRQ